MHKPLPEILLAQADALRLNIPEKVYQAFRSHFHSAKRRAIPFLFTLPVWWSWWQANHWEERGLKGNGYVMARFNDSGPYAPDNVYPARASENAADVDKDRLILSAKEAWVRRKADPHFTWHLAVRGDGHPKSRSVVTPMGVFGSAALAAEIYRVERQTAARWARDGVRGWRY